MSRLYFQESRAEAVAVIQRLLDDDTDALDPRAHLERLMPNRCPDCGGSNVSEADDEGLIDCMDCGIWFNPLHPNNSPLREGLDDEVDPLNYANGTVNAEQMANELGFSYEGKSNPGSDGSVKDIWSKQLDRDVQARMNFAADPTRVNLFLYACTNGAINFKLVDKLENVPVSQIRKFIQNWSGLANFSATDALAWPARRRYESIDDEIPDLRAYAMEYGETPRIQKSFSRTTPESVEHGDFSETGWIDEDGLDMTPDEYDRIDGITAVDKAVEYLWNEGATEHSSSSFDSGGWYSSNWNQIDMRTGEEEQRSYHLKGFLPAQLEEVYNKLREKRARMRFR